MSELGSWKTAKSYTVTTKDGNHSITLLARSPDEAITLAKDVWPRVAQAAQSKAGQKMEISDELVAELTKKS